MGVVAAGRIGLAVLKRMKPFDVHLHYTDRHRLPAEVERELGLTFHENVESLVSVCDVVSIHCPLHAETEHMFDDSLIGKMKRGSYIVNTARGKICDRDAVVRALESGQLAGYAGDVWFPAAAAQRSSMADDAQPRDDAAHVRHLSLGAGPLCGGRSRDTRVLVGRAARSGRSTSSCREALSPGRERTRTAKGDATGGSEEAARFTAG